jgi:hypothetical protein
MTQTSATPTTSVSAPFSCGPSRKIRAVRNSSCRLNKNPQKKKKKKLSLSSTPSFGQDSSSSLICNDKMRKVNKKAANEVMWTGGRLYCWSWFRGRCTTFVNLNGASTELQCFWLHCCMCTVWCHRPHNFIFFSSKIDSRLNSNSNSFSTSRFHKQI